MRTMNKRLLTRTFNLFLPALLIVMAGWSPMIGMGQECSDITLTGAGKDYDNGRFRKAITTLEQCVQKGFSDKQKLQAYRLMTLSYLAMDSLGPARVYCGYLLGINPNYETNIFDPVAFTELLEEVRQAGGNQLVTSVSKKAENIDQAPATILVVSRKEIEERGYMDLVELLRDVPGFDLTMFYGSEYANVYQRGFRQNNTEKTLLMVDGVEENDLWTNWAYLERQYPISAIERVEIIYGPASTMYGPNAFAGVINVITRNAEEAIRAGRSIGISANLNYGTYNTRCLDLSLYGKKRNFSFALTSRLYKSDEMDLSSQNFFAYDPEVYDTVDYQKLLSIQSGAASYLTAHDLPFTHPYYELSADSNQLWLTPEGISQARSLDKSGYAQTVNGNPVGFTNRTASWLLNGKFRLGNFSLGFQTWRNSRGSTTQYTDTYVPGSDNGFNWVPQLSYFYVKYESQLNEKLFVSNLTTYRIHVLTEDSRFVYVTNYARGDKKLFDLVADAPPVWITQYAYEISKQLRNELKVIYTPVSTFDLISGLEIRNSSLQGSYLFSLTPTPQDSATLNPQPKGGNTFNVWDIGLYAQGTWRPIDKIRITLGLRYDYNRVRDSGGFGSALSPRVAVVFTPGKFTFKAIYSRGIMNVSNWTKYSTAGNRIPNPTLKTENIINFELSAGYRLNKLFHAELVGYYDIINDVVGTIPVSGNPGMNQNANIGKFRIAGIQAVTTFTWESFNAWFNYTFCDPRQIYSEKGDVDNRVGDIASHQFNLGANKLFFNQLNVNLRLNFTGNRPVGPGTSVPLNTADFPAIALLNGAISYTNAKLVPGLSLQLVCNNILNTRYYHPGTKAADGVLNPTEILQRDRHFVFRALYQF